MTHMRKTVGVLAALALTACGRPPEVAFEDGLPGKEATQVEVPSQSGQGLTQAQTQEQGGTQAMAEGQASGLFLLTLGGTAVVNGSTAWALGVLGAVVSSEPTSVQGDVAVFGPHTPVLSDTTWRLTMTRTAPNAFDYVLEGKQKGADDSTYVAVLSGSHTVAVDDAGQARKGYGEGGFLIAWDKVAGLSPSSPRKTGSVEVRYARLSPTSEVTVEADFTEQSSTSTTPVTAAYRYAQVPGGEGSFTFGADVNLQPWDAALSANERWSIHSRWLASGAGRSDVRATGGDLTAPALLNECWDVHFLSTYLRNSDHPADDYGVEAEACAIQGPVYAE